MSLQIRVPGVPAPQGSKRHVGRGRLIEQSKRVGPWRDAVRAATMAELGGKPYSYGAAAAPLVVHVDFYMPLPRTHFGTGRNAGTIRASAPGRPATRPDVDKLARAVLDALKQGGAYADDSQVVGLIACKYWVFNGQAPCAVITITAARGG